MLDQFGGRKFLLTVLVLICLLVLVLTGNLDVKEFVMFATANLGIYTAGNAVEKFAE